MWKELSHSWNLFVVLYWTLHTNRPTVSRTQHDWLYVFLCAPVYSSMLMQHRCVLSPVGVNAVELWKHMFFLASRSHRTCPYLIHRWWTYISLTTSQSGWATGKARACTARTNSKFTAKSWQQFVPLVPYFKHCYTIDMYGTFLCGALHVCTSKVPQTRGISRLMSIAA